MTFPINKHSGFLQRIRNFGANTAGVAAMEFALVVPIMIGLYFMLNETANGLRAARKVTMTARIMADLASRSADLSDAALKDLLDSSGPIFDPFSATTGSFRITSFRFDASGKGFVDWSEIRGTGLGARYARCTPTDALPSNPSLVPIAVPQGLKIANTSLVLAETMMQYTPSVGWAITGTLDLKDKLYMRPRDSSFVTRAGVPSPSPLPCPGYT